MLTWLSASLSVMLSAQTGSQWPTQMPSSPMRAICDRDRPQP